MAEDLGLNEANARGRKPRCDNGLDAGDTRAQQMSLVFLINKSDSPSLYQTLKATCYQLFSSRFNLQQSVIMDEINS